MITPTDATLAVLAGAPDPTPGAAPTGAADFLAAILQALAPGADPATAAPDPADADAPATTAVDAAALGLAVPGVPTVVPGVVAGVVAGATPAVPASGSQPAPGHANVAAGTAGDSTGTTSDIRMSAYEAGAAPTTRAGSDVSPAPGHANVAAGTAGDPTGTTGDIRMSGDAPPAPTTPSTPVAPMSGPTPAAPPTPAATGRTAALTHQVIPEVTSLLSRGDGTHRITLTLKPEALGEVRVVMTVRDGAVHVRLAAGHEAQRALIDGSPELHRVLELAGAHETRVVVRDLGSAAPTTQTGSGNDLTQGFAAGHDRHDAHQDQHAGTRAQDPATDGTNPRTTRGTTGASQPRSVEPGTHIRTAGVDVSM